MNEDVNSDMTYFDHFFLFSQSSQGSVRTDNYELYLQMAKFQSLTLQE